MADIRDNETVEELQDELYQLMVKQKITSLEITKRLVDNNNEFCPDTLRKLVTYHINKAVDKKVENLYNTSILTKENSVVTDTPMPYKSIVFTDKVDKLDLNIFKKINADNDNYQREQIKKHYDFLVKRLGFQLSYEAIMSMQILHDMEKDIIIIKMITTKGKEVRVEVAYDIYDFEMNGGKLEVIEKHKKEILNKYTAQTSLIGYIDQTELFKKRFDNNIDPMLYKFVKDYFTVKFSFADIVHTEIAKAKDGFSYRITIFLKSADVQSFTTTDTMFNHFIKEQKDKTHNVEQRFSKGTLEDKEIIARGGKGNATAIYNDGTFVLDDNGRPVLSSAQQRKKQENENAMGAWIKKINELDAIEDSIKKEKRNKGIKSKIKQQQILFLMKFASPEKYEKLANQLMDMLNLKEDLYEEN